MKKYSDWLKVYEITIKGNQGLPTDGDDKGNKYLSDIERRGKEKAGLEGRVDPRRLGERIMELSDKVQGLISNKDKKDKLEKLAETVIRNEYGSILDNVELDIKFIKPGKVKDFMDECECEELPSYRLLNDPEIRKEIDKRKIANNITQGEAKNTKRILNMPEVKEEVVNIFGQRVSDELYLAWNEITSIADKLDWIIPVDIKADMMERAPQGLAGACAVKWPDKKKEDEDLTKKVLKSLEDKEDLTSSEEEISELLSDGKPKIMARGIDFPMLLHESVKGIYELIATAGIPEDKRTSEIVILNTDTLKDEAEDFKYGPELAADLRDFINQNPKVDEAENMRERVWGKMIVMPAGDFLILMKGILSKSPEARTKIDSIIDEVIKELKDWELNQHLPNYEDDDEEEGEDTTSTMSSDSEKEVVSTEEEEIDYSKLRKKELQDEIDAALDAGDYNKVAKLSKYLKEGLNYKKRK